MLARTNQAVGAAPAAIVVAAGGAATILGAWFFQYGLGYEPCELCLAQRVPYYVAIPLAAIVAAAALRQAPRALVMIGLLAVALTMLAGAWMGTYHAGVEWKWWQGPTACTGGPSTAPRGNLLEKLDRVRVVPCDEAAWRFLGLSLAGYNVLISLALAGVALWGARTSSRPPYGSSSVSQ